MFETMIDRERKIRELFDEKKWRSMWILYSAGLLLYLALIILCMRLWLLLQKCHCVN